MCPPWYAVKNPAPCLEAVDAFRPRRASPAPTAPAAPLCPRAPVGAAARHSEPAPSDVHAGSSSRRPGLPHMTDSVEEDPSPAIVSSPVRRVSVPTSSCTGGSLEQAFGKQRKRIILFFFSHIEVKEKLRWPSLIRCKVLGWAGWSIGGCTRDSRTLGPSSCGWLDLFSFGDQVGDRQARRGRLRVGPGCARPAAGGLPDHAPPAHHAPRSCGSKHELSQASLHILESGGLTILVRAASR